VCESRPESGSVAIHSTSTCRLLHVIRHAQGKRHGTLRARDKDEAPSVSTVHARLDGFTHSSSWLNPSKVSSHSPYKLVAGLKETVEVRVWSQVTVP
jgi:hypothetical protein